MCMCMRCMILVIKYVVFLKAHDIVFLCFMAVNAIGRMHVYAVCNTYYS